MFCFYRKYWLTVDVTDPMIITPSSSTSSTEMTNWDIWKLCSANLSMIKYSEFIIRKITFHSKQQLYPAGNVFFFFAIRHCTINHFYHSADPVVYLFIVKWVLKYPCFSPYWIIVFYHWIKYYWEIVDHTNVIVLFSDLAIQSEFQFLRYICKQ